MNSSLAEIIVQLPEVYEAAQFNREDLFAILEGSAGFFSGVLGRDPFSSLGAAIGVIGRFASRCNTGNLQENLNKTLEWLTFGQQYAALEDSSDLDFDQLNVESVPEVMKVRQIPPILKSISILKVYEKKTTNKKTSTASKDSWSC